MGCLFGCFRAKDDESTTDSVSQAKHNVILIVSFCFSRSLICNSVFNSAVSVLTSLV